MTAEYVTTKLCTKCGEIKPTTEFRKSVNARDGLSCHCKACKKASDAAYRATNPDKIRAAKAKWYAANREKHNANTAKWDRANREKAKAYRAAWNVANQEKVKASKIKWNLDNREKMKAIQAKRYADNREKVIAAAIAWRKSNPEKTKEYRRVANHNRRAREREAGGKLSIGLADRLFKLQRGKCACCGLPLGDDYHLDHIMPVALGGTNTDNNIQLLRATCNMQKNARHPVDFMRQRGFLL